MTGMTVLARLVSRAEHGEAELCPISSKEIHMSGTTENSANGGLVDSPVALAAFINRLDKDGHFAAWEQPRLFSEEVRAGFRSLR
jgi:hypothetical protein